MFIPNTETVLRMGDGLNIVCAVDDSEAIETFIGPIVDDIDWDNEGRHDKPMVSRRILVTQPSIPVRCNRSPAGCQRG